MVGRTFVPDEDMGEWTVHLDAPEGTSLEGTSEIGQQLVKELGGHRRRARTSSQSSPSARRTFTCSCMRSRSRARTETQDEMIAEMRRRLARASVVPSELHDPEPARRRRAGRLPDQREAARAGSQPPGRLLDEGVRRGAAAAQPGRPQALAEHLEPGDPRRRRSQARGRPRRPGWRPSAARFASPWPATTRSRPIAKAASSIRSRFACSRSSAATSRRSARSPCRRRAARPSASTTSPGSNAGSGPASCSASNRQFSVGLVADIAPGHALDEASNDVRKLLADLNLPPDMSLHAQRPDEDPRRDDPESHHGHRAGDDLRLHGAGGAVRELRPAHRHHAGAAAVDPVRAVHAVGDEPDARICGAPSASCCCSAS